MRRLTFVPITVLICSLAIGQGRHALLVGINHYIRPESPVAGAWRNDIHDLRGCENDVDAMREVLVDIYGWQPEDITVLKSDQATRGAILGGLDTLASESAQGDQVLFFYSGHGSTVKNTKSMLHRFESEGQSAFGVSNTIVPADTLTGAADVTDKRLAAKFNLILDRGAKLTAVFDSCFSGEIARSANPNVTYKDVPPPELDSIDVADPDLPENQLPSSRGAVILSASRYWEHSAEEDIAGIPRGAFAWALTETLSSSGGSSDLSSLFSEARSKIKTLGLPQEPTMDALPAAGAQGFLSQSPAKEGVRIPILSSKGSDIVLGGGVALGLSKGAQLVGTLGGSSVSVVIDSEPSIAEAHATFLSGDKQLLGMVKRLQVVSWGTADLPGLRVAIPTISKNIADVEAASQKAPDRNEPLPVGLSAGLQFGNGPGRNLVSVAASDVADYELCGRWKDGKLRYNWEARIGEPNARAPSGPIGPHEICLAGLPSEMPAETEWVEARDPDVDAKLVSLAVKLATIRNWLNLSSHDDPAAFPYQLALMDEGTHKPVTPGSTVFTDGHYKLALERASEGAESGAQPRFIYVFEIDPSYSGNLIFPGDSMADKAHTLHKTEENLTTSFGFQAPLGVETFILVTATEPLPLGLFTFSGVLPVARDSVSPLEALIRLADGANRDGDQPSAPSGWSIQRITFMSSKH